MSLFYAWLMFWLTMHSGLEVTLLPNCESFFHCLSASGDAGEKLGVILIPDSLDALVFPFLKLVESSYFEILVWYPLIWITVISEAGYQVGPFSQNSHSSILGKFSETIFWCFLPLVFFLYFSENLFNFTNISNSNTNIISAIMLLILKNWALFFESAWVSSVCSICSLLPSSICFQNVVSSFNSLRILMIF